MCDYVLDPFGDVILTLSNPNAPFAVWDDSEDGPALTEPSVNPETVEKPTPPAVHTLPAEILLPLVEPTAVAEDITIARNELPAPQDNNEASPQQEESQTSTISTESVTFLLSSRHLILASPVFKAMLTGGWKEGDKDNGPVRRGCAEDWDTEALVTVMNVLHSYYRQVPKKVSLEMLAKIAVIVDYYKIHEAFQVIASLWINALKMSLPESPGRDLILWILVSWVFEDAAIFRKVTKVAILRSKKDITIPHELPIPAVINRINQLRKDSIDVISAAFRGLRDDYIHGRQGCNFECSAMHLGTLMKNLSGLKFLSYPPETPNGGLSLAGVVECITTMRSPKWYIDDGKSYKRCSHASHRCPQRSKEVGDAAFEPGLTREQPGDVHMGPLNEFAELLVHGIRENMEGLRLDNVASSG